MKREHHGDETRPKPAAAIAAFDGECRLVFDDLPQESVCVFDAVIGRRDHASPRKARVGPRGSRWPPRELTVPRRLLGRYLDVAVADPCVPCCWCGVRDVCVVAGGSSSSSCTSLRKLRCSSRYSLATTPAVNLALWSSTWQRFPSAHVQAARKPVGSSSTAAPTPTLTITAATSAATSGYLTAAIR